MPRGILISGTNWIGDAVMSVAAIRELRRLFPDQALTLLAKRWVSGLFEGQGLVDAVVHPEDYPGTRLPGRLRGFSHAVLFRNSFKAALQVWTARIPRRIGYARDFRSWMLTCAARPRIRSLGRHQTYYYLDLLFQCGLSERNYLEEDDFQPDVRLEARPEWVEQARALLRQEGIDEGERLAVIHAGAAYGAAKRWFPERYGQLAGRLIREEDARVVLVGSQSERPLAEQVQAASPEPLCLLNGRTSLGQLMGLISLSACFISNDSGPMHLAAALGVPQVALFGSTDLDATGPFSPQARAIYKKVECSPCLLRECPIDLRCFAGISVDEVLQAARRQMRGHG
ncbi:MAG TPA: lipopolysaccharide heptosyltransferase II [Acidobacteriota bacterium]|nr:lipopolysaccharide heptosyltransferase II [Acidobacteriota bacterium]